MAFEETREAIKRSGNSRTTVALALIHTVVFFLVIFSRSPLPLPGSPEAIELSNRGPFHFDIWELPTGSYVAGRYFHHDLDFRYLFVAGILGILAMMPLAIAIDFVPMSEVASTYAFAAVWLLGGTLQWWLVGCFWDLSRRRKHRGARSRPASESAT